MPTLRAEFADWQQADQAIAALKREAIPVNQVRLSEHQNYLAQYTASTPAGLTPTLSADVPASFMNASTPLLSQTSHQSPVLVELQVEDDDWRRAEALMHKWRAQQLQRSESSTRQ